MSTKPKYTRDGLDIDAKAFAVAEAIAKHRKIGAAGVTDPYPKELDAELLSITGLTAAERKKAEQAQTIVTVGLALANGEGAIEHMSKNKDVAQVTSELKWGTSKIAAATDRHKSYPNRMGGEGAPNIEKYAQTNVRFTVAAAGNRGDFAKVRTHLGSQAAALWS